LLRKRHREKGVNLRKIEPKENFQKKHRIQKTGIELQRDRNNKIYSEQT